MSHLPPPNIPTISSQLLYRRTVINKVAIAASSLSVLTTLLAFYFFIRMEKRYRHQLIIINIFGDLIRAICYLVFCVLNLLGRAPVPGSYGCEAIGYFLSVGHELTDFTVLFIAIHGALQVYRPCVNNSYPRYGLKPHKRLVGLVLFLLPNLLAALPYTVRGRHAAYANGGSICWLPVRPLWYRLALSWIPRYIIIISILTLSLMVYCHVRKQFNAFSSVWALQLPVVPHHHESDPAIAIPEESQIRPSKVAFVDEQIEAEVAARTAEKIQERRSSMPEPRSVLKQPTNTHARLSYNSKTSQQPLNHHRHTSSDSDVRNMWLPFSFGGLLSESVSQPRKNSVVTCSTSDSKDSSKTLPASMPSRGMKCLLSPFRSRSSSHTTSIRRSSIQDPEKSVSDISVRQMMDAKRQIIMFQLRMNFIYPLIYVFMWIIPLVLHGMQYSGRFASAPPMILAAMVTFCIASMGWINCLVFLLRETPWRGLKRPTLNLTCFRENPKRKPSPASENEDSFPDYFTPSPLILPATENITPGTTSSSAQKSSSSRDQRRTIHRTSNPSTPKKKALQRLELEQIERSEHNENASPTAIVDKHGVGQERNWWDDDVDGDDVRSSAH